MLYTLNLHSDVYQLNISKTPSIKLKDLKFLLFKHKKTGQNKLLEM